jgi:methylmalonyl-CoA mutase
VDNDVHVLGVSSLAGGHKTLVPAARRALDDLGRPDILIALGGVIPAADFNELKTAGTSAVFGPGTVVAEAALELLELIAAPAAS